MKELKFMILFNKIVFFFKLWWLQLPTQICNLSQGYYLKNGSTLDWNALKLSDRQIGFATFPELVECRNQTLCFVGSLTLFSVGRYVAWREWDAIK